MGGRGNGLQRQVFVTHWCLFVYVGNLLPKLWEPLHKMQNNTYLSLSHLIHCYLKSEEASGNLSWEMEPGVSNIIQLILTISWLYSAHNEIITLNKIYELDFFFNEVS